VQVSKKLASSDFKNGRVSDPGLISSKHAKSVKKFTKEYFDKAVIKHREHEQRVRERATKEDAARGIKSTTPDGDPSTKADAMDLDDEVKLTDDEMSDEGAVKPERAGSTESTTQKRKRDSDEEDVSASPTESAKRFKSDMDAPTPPPPPPSPPADSPDVQDGEESYGTMVAGSDENVVMALNGDTKQLDMVSDGHSKQLDTLPDGRVALELASGANGPS
jgi:[histone H3]-lysine36 N-trimethyltransferase